MTLENLLDNFITEKVREEYEADRALHISSGKLSASMLGWPLQWQVLKLLGAKEKPIDDYTLRKFIRGKQVEDWLVAKFADQPIMVSTQEKVEYRNCVGIIDLLIQDTSYGFLPIEIKSVSNMKFKRVDREGPDRSHALQGAFYAIAKGLQHFMIAYVSTDDLRVKEFVYDTSRWQDEVDRIISLFENTYPAVPPFQAVEKWWTDPKYNKYPQYTNLTEEQLKQKTAD